MGGGWEGRGGQREAASNVRNEGSTVDGEVSSPRRTVWYVNAPCDEMARLRIDKARNSYGGRAGYTHSFLEIISYLFPLVRRRAAERRRIKERRNRQFNRRRGDTPRRARALSEEGAAGLSACHRRHQLVNGNAAPSATAVCSSTAAVRQGRRQRRAIGRTVRRCTSCRGSGSTLGTRTPAALRKS